MYLQRTLNLQDLLEKKSHFLLGPRSTGKTTLIKHQLSDKAININLLKTETYFLLQSKPWELENIIKANSLLDKFVVIDEIQKIPELLNEVHRLIEEDGIRFLLTGSSARKLRNSGVNLLAGRAWRAELFSLTSIEIPNFNLDDYLLYGGLPQVINSSLPYEELDAYVKTYLQEEIQAEALIRKLQSFTKFLRTASISNGEMLNFAKIASDTGIPASTIREYYQLLEDTLVGFILPAWTKTIKRKAVSTAKFYFFDLGVSNTLAGINFIPKQSDLYGKAFEHFIALEMRAYISYKRKKVKMSYWHSYRKDEVDFIIDDKLAIEVKSTDNVQAKHLKGLRRLKEESICDAYYLVCCDKNNRVNDDIHIIHWQDFIAKLWSGEIL